MVLVLTQTESQKLSLEWLKVFLKLWVLPEVLKENFFLNSNYNIHFKDFFKGKRSSVNFYLYESVEAEELLPWKAFTLEHQNKCKSPVVFRGAYLKLPLPQKSGYGLI